VPAAQTTTRTGPPRTWVSRPPATKHRIRRDPAARFGLRGALLGLGLALAVLSPFEPFAIGRTGRPEAANRAGDASAATLEDVLCENVPREAIVRTRRGIAGSRNGDLILIPEPPDFVNGGLTHATPFDYTQEVPLLLYGPGFVRPGVYADPVTLADIAPTQAALLGFPFAAPDGRSLDDALLPESERPVPALILTVVWDSVGDNVLERWPSAWPVLASLRDGGAWFEEATVGAAPSNTPVAHATIGTGAFPRRHGLVDVYVRIRGELIEPMDRGPTTLRGATLADRYDLAMGNAPIVGTLGTLSDHLTMMSHGSEFDGGDRDIAVTREDEGGPTTGVESTAWNLTEAMAPYYEFPAYANELPGLQTYVDEVDRADGALDGRWRDNDIAQLGEGFDTPARAMYQLTLLRTMIEREGFGADEVPDLLFVNFKTADKIGHLFSADGIEMSDTLVAQDAALGELVAYLDEQVGAGRWVMVLAADHGTQRDPDTTGAFMIDADKLRALISARFDRDGDDVPVIQKLRPSQVWLDVDELESNGATVEDVGWFLMGLTRAQTFVGPTPPPEEEADLTVFAAVTPSASFGDLPCLP
jgi:hypothetical protein